MAEAGPGSAGGYVAFISYSHKDAAMGRWLHRKLEGYRLPKRLVGTEGEDGEVPARLTPIFRDRDELPAAGDLSERVRGALAVSRNLIVLCSPHSAASPWVAKEIATFRELHPGRPVFTAIVDGEPGQCFSPTLLEGGVEPLAADLRKEGDGRRLGLLKLVAGLAGVGLDSLIQRDATRRVRRVTYVTAAAVTAMLIMALLTAIALNARAEAERQRSEAEGLVEFMLTDLRNRLRTVGRLDIMRTVNERALRRYQQAHGAGSESGDALSRRARILHAIGEDEITLGNVNGAQRIFRQAYQSTQGELERNAGQLERQLDHARSEYWLGRIHELKGEWADAEQRYLRFAAACDRMVGQAPGDPTYMTEVAWSRVNLGNIQMGGKKDYAAAQRRYEEATLWFGRAAAAKPRDVDAARALANAYAWLADSFHMQSRWNESLQARERQFRIAERLHRAEPASADLEFRYAAAARGFGHALLKTGDRAGAAWALTQADRTARKLAAQDSRNGDWVLLKAMLACDFIFTKVGLLGGDPSSRLRAEVREAASKLTVEGNPRVAEISKCVAALGA